MQEDDCMGGGGAGQLVVRIFEGKDSADLKSAELLAGT
jgi:hypothetical protein